MTEDLTPDEQAEFEERAAIIEFCANEARADAENAARQIILAKRQKRATSDPSAF